MDGRSLELTSGQMPTWPTTKIVSVNNFCNRFAYQK